MSERILLSKREASAALGISVRTLETLIAVKQLRSVRVGRRRMIARVELEQFARRDHITRPAPAVQTTEETGNGH